MSLLIVDYLKAFGWGLVGAITMAVSLWLLLKVITFGTAQAMEPLERLQRFLFTLAPPPIVPAAP